MAGKEGEEAALAALKEVMGAFYTEGRKKGLGMTPRKGDVFICTSPKAGTTWMQMIAHSLRTMVSGQSPRQVLSELSSRPHRRC